MYRFMVPDVKIVCARAFYARHSLNKSAKRLLGDFGSRHDELKPFDRFNTASPSSRARRTSESKSNARESVFSTKHSRVFVDLDRTRPHLLSVRDLFSGEGDSGERVSPMHREGKVEKEGMEGSEP